MSLGILSSMYRSRLAARPSHYELFMLLALIALAGCARPLVVPEVTESPAPGADSDAGIEASRISQAQISLIALQFELDGQGENIDSIAFWEAPDPEDTLLFVTAKDNQLVEVWRYPFHGGEQQPLRHESFGQNAVVNGVGVDQAGDRLYISTAEPLSSVSVFSLPDLVPLDTFRHATLDLQSEPNLAVLHRESGETWLYVTADDVVYVLDAVSGVAITQFEPAKGLETIAADDFYQLVYIPDENEQTGVYVYQADGTPFEQHGSNRFGAGLFQKDAEGIIVYTCTSQAGTDDGTGFIIVADQRDEQTDFEVFDRQTWQHRATVHIAGVAVTDGVASTQKPLPHYPLGLLAVVNDDQTVVGVGWDDVFQALGFSC